AELHAVRVWRDHNQIGALSPYWRLEMLEAARRHLADAFNATLGGVPSDVSVRLVVCEGYTADALVAYADRNDDLLVLGTSRRRRLFWGEMTMRRCVQRARCAVTVVPNIGSDRRLLKEFHKELQELVGPIRTDP